MTKSEMPTVNVTTSCKLSRKQVFKAVETSFAAFDFTRKESKGGNLFEDDDLPINLLVSAIKIPHGEPKPLRIVLPHSFIGSEADICLIVKDLEKGWKVNHENTVHHYKELLQEKAVSSVNEVMPLRQLRVEFKTFESRAKLAKRYDIFLVDKRIAKFVPRYLGKEIYQAGKLPIPVDLEKDDLSNEVSKALKTSTMSMTNSGTCTRIQVGLSSQSAAQVSENINAVVKGIEKKFPGKFENVRGLTLRFGTCDWTVPIYMSFENRDKVVIPMIASKPAPLVDDLTTLTGGWKVAVYPGGVVKKVKDKNYKPTAIDRADIIDSKLPKKIKKDSKPPKKKMKKSAAAK